MIIWFNCHVCSLILYVRPAAHVSNGWKSQIRPVVGRIQYFDTLNHTILLNLLRREIKDERVVQMVKRYLKSGVMENGVVIGTREGSPQGGNLSPLLANVYLNEFDQEYEKRGVPCIRYADDIVLLAKSNRAAKRLLETSKKYLERTLKIRVNQKKSRVVSVFVIWNFKFLGFALGSMSGFIQSHGKSSSTHWETSLSGDAVRVSDLRWKD